MKLLLFALLGLLTFSNLLAMLLGDEIDCDDCLEGLKEIDV